MPIPEIDLKRELTEVGSRLMSPPDEIDQLLPLLDWVEHCLSYVKQQPVVEIQYMLIPTFKALITDGLIKHPDIDVRVGVTACLTEISRITAPDIPYNDDVMTEVFRLIVSSFKGLSDNSNKSFSKRVSILEIVARVRLCAVLLDLECDDLVVEMFHIFYKCIRDFHAAIVFASMESIMSLVIEESGEISTNQLLVLLSVLRKDNKDASSIARKLGEKVVKNSATILKPHIVEGIRSLKVKLLDYDFVVTLACQTTQLDTPPTNDVLSTPEVNGSGSVVLVDEDGVQSVVAASNGSTEVIFVEDANMEVLKLTSKPDSNVVVRNAEIVHDQAPWQDTPTSDMSINPEAAASPNSEMKSEKVVNKRGRKPKIAKKTATLTDACNMSQPAINRQLENKSDSNNKRSSSKVIGNYVVALDAPSLRMSFPGKGSSKRIMKSKKAISTHEKKSSHQSAENDTRDGIIDIETRSLCSEKDTPNRVERVASDLASLVEVEISQGIDGESENTILNQTDEQLVTPRTKKRGRPRKDTSISPATGTKDRVSSEGISKKRSRNRSTPTEGGKQLEEELVGLRIKVWWPKDKVFYDGLVESFDPIKKKHQILYTDNERETLNLHKQKWEFADSNVGSEKKGEASHTKTGDSSDAQLVRKLKMDSDSAGKTGNTGAPSKRRGRPPKSAAALDIHASEDKSTKPEGKVDANVLNIDSMTDAGNPAKSVGSMPNSLPNLNDLECDSGEEQQAPGNDGTPAKEDYILSTCAVNNSTPTGATVGININEPFSLGNDESSYLDLDKNITPIDFQSDVNLTEQVMLGPLRGSKTERMSKETSASDSKIISTKRTARTSSNSSLTTVTGSADTLVKRRRGRLSKLLLGSSDEKSEVLVNQLGDSGFDESKSGGHCDNLVP